MHMATQSCPEWAETLYTPAVICHEMWAALGKARWLSAAEGADSEKLSANSTPRS